jgi:hypothetical protein
MGPPTASRDLAIPCKAIAEGLLAIEKTSMARIK